MELKYLRLIQTIAEEGNISNSADRLFLTQSALSHQLREIEERLGFKVFLRSRNNWKLTREGEELHVLAKKVLGDIASGMQKIQEIQEGSQGIIRLSTECYSFYQGLPQFVEKMALLYPMIDIHLNIEDTKDPISKLLSNDLDMTITTSIPDHSDLDSVQVFEDEIFGIIHEEHDFADQKFLAAKDFESIHLLIHSYPLETVSVYQDFLKPNKVEPMKITAVPMTEIALEMVQSNMGVICLPKWMLSAFKISKDLKFKPLGKNGFKRKHYLIYRKEGASKNYIQDFIQNIEEEFALSKI